jgi:hypothetical protein
MKPIAPNKLTHIIHWLVWIHLLYGSEKKLIELRAVVRRICRVRIA